MGKVEKSLKSFIESLPNDKLTSISTLGATLYKDENYRLDMQGLKSDDPQGKNQRFYLTIGRLKTSQTLAAVLAPVEPAWSVRQIKDGLVAGITI